MPERYFHTPGDPVLGHALRRINIHRIHLLEAAGSLETLGKATAANGGRVVMQKV
jgi:hypothetical protein